MRFETSAVGEERGRHQSPTHDWSCGGERGGWAGEDGWWGEEEARDGSLVLARLTYQEYERCVISVFFPVW